MTQPRPLPPRPRRSQPPRPRLRDPEAAAGQARRSSPPPPPRRSPRGDATPPPARRVAAAELLAVELPRKDQPSLVTSAPPMHAVVPAATAPEAAPRRSEPARDIHPGDVIAGRYRVEAVMGRSRGLLLDCSHTGFDQRVALRVISPDLADAKAVDRFQREIRILSKLESEHVARILDVGTLPSGALYLVREHLDGASLADETRGHGMTVRAAVDRFLQVAEAVAEAHCHGVVLRDLQSTNVFVTRKRNGEPVAKLTDFGTCKVIKKREGELSCTRLLGLSPSASPEIIRQQSDIDERADIWSLGCLLYEMLTGGPAFIGDGTALMLAIAQDNPVPPSSLRRDVDVPVEIDRIILRALEKRAADRFRTVFEMARGLNRFASPRGRVIIEQIARLAGEEPTALSQPPVDLPVMAASHAVADEDTDESMSFSISVNPSQPPRASVPPPAAIPSAVPSPAAPSAPGVAPLPLASSPSYGSGFRPPQVASLPPSSTPFPWEVEVPSPGHRKVKVAALLAALPICAVLLALVLGGEPEASLAQASLRLPTYDAIATQVGDTVEDEVTEAEVTEANRASEREAREAAEPRRAVASPRAARPQARSQRQFLSTIARAEPSREARPSQRDGGEAAASKKTTTPTAEKERGTLVALAVGASCAFAIDGVARGSSSSVKATLPVGVHTVSCAPVSGASRSRSVTVTPGKAAVAVFRF